MTHKLSLILGSLLFALVLAGCSSTPPAEEAPVNEVEIVEEAPAIEEIIVEEDAMMEEEVVEEDAMMEEEAQVVEDEL
jgi:PBP1b-binding outer membrane lipoprotein LpoB